MLKVDCQGRIEIKQSGDTNLLLSKAKYNQDFLPRSASFPGHKAFGVITEQAEVSLSWLGWAERRRGW